jgi:hypothetical protein
MFINIQNATIATNRPESEGSLSCLLKAQFFPHGPEPAKMDKIICYIEFHMPHSID